MHLCPRCKNADFLHRQLMFAAESCAFVGSIDSSTIIHTTQPFGTTQLSAYSIIDSTSRGQQCAVLGFSDGNLAIWNPRKGKNDHLGRTRKQSVCALATTARLGDHAESLIFWVTRRTKSSEIFVRSPHMESNPTRILKRRATVQSLKCSRSGRILIATTSDSILVGALKNSVDVSAISSASFEYDWEEIRCKLPPNCFDFRIAEATNARIETILETDRIPEVNVHDRLDIAFGGLDGCIYVYDSILGNLGIIDGRQQPLKRTQLSPREMHWHREAVGALAFSPDGMAHRTVSINVLEANTTCRQLPCLWWSGNSTCSLAARHRDQNILTSPGIARAKHFYLIFWQHVCRGYGRQLNHGSFDN